MKWVLTATLAVLPIRSFEVTLKTPRWGLHMTLNLSHPISHSLARRRPRLATSSATEEVLRGQGNVAHASAVRALPIGGIDPLADDHR